MKFRIIKGYDNKVRATSFQHWCGILSFLIFLKLSRNGLCPCKFVTEVRNPQKAFHVWKLSSNFEYLCQINLWWRLSVVQFCLQLFCDRTPVTRFPILTDFDHQFYDKRTNLHWLELFYRYFLRFFSLYVISNCRS